MSDQPVEIIGNAYAELDAMAKDMGSTLSAPFMTLSFMALLVIPSLKLSDRGLFDVGSFNFTSLDVV
jgi:adenine deaminase